MTVENLSPFSVAEFRAHAHAALQSLAARGGVGILAGGTGLWLRAVADGIDAVAIVTPNHMHAPVAMQFLRRGIHVICDKPLTATLPEAKKLAKAAEASGVVFALTHNYTGYPMIRQAKAMVAAGATRVGASAGVKIVQESRGQKPTTATSTGY